MSPDGEALLTWCVRAGTELADVTVRTGLLAGAVAADWLDDHGRDWSERLERVRRELDAAADAATDLGRHLATTSPGPPPDAGLLAALAAAAAAGGRGPQLAGTDGSRVQDVRGMRLAELPDDPVP